MGMENHVLQFFIICVRSEIESILKKNCHAKEMKVAISLCSSFFNDCNKFTRPNITSIINVIHRLFTIQAEFSSNENSNNTNISHQ